MIEEYIKQPDNSWIKKTTYEEVVDLDGNTIGNQISYCDVQIMNAQKIIDENKAKKESLVSILKAISSQGVSHSQSIEIRTPDSTQIPQKKDFRTDMQSIRQRQKRG